LQQDVDLEARSVYKRLTRAALPCRLTLRLAT
jgi:hypothetical protein